MRGNIWTVVIVGALLALIPGILTGGDAEIGQLLGSLSPVVGLLLFVVAMAGVIRFVFGGGGGF
jgi:hypothetical protein